MDLHLGKRVGKRAAQPRIDASHLSKHTEHLRDFVPAVRELIWNAADAKARDILVRFHKRAKLLDLVVIDDGEGMGQDGLDAIVSLDFSPSANDPDKRGRMGNGSKGFVHHAAGLRVETRRVDESNICAIEYTPGQLIAMWNTHCVDWDILEPPSNHPIRVSGTVVTLLGLGTGEGVNPKHDRSARRLIEELASRLPMNVARRVTIVDEQGKSHRLKSRKLVGEKIEGEGVIEGLGSTSYELGVLPDPDINVDRLEIWALEPVCDIHVFLANIRPSPALATLLRPVRQILDHPQVAGSIVVPGLNGMVGQDRMSFRQDLYDDEDLVFRLVRFLHDVILPRVQAVLGRDLTKRLASTDAETMRHDLVRMFQDVGAAPQGRTPVVDVDLLRVSPSVVNLEPGEQISLEIADPKSDLIYTWDDTDSGGTLNQKRGTKTTFTAGNKVGEFRLRVSASGRDQIIAVNIVLELPFGFSQRMRTVLPRQRITLRLINTKRTSGRFAWDDTECGGTLQVAEDGLSAIYEAGEVEAEFSVTVIEQGVSVERLPRTTKCFLCVARKSGEGQKRMPSDSVFLYPDKSGEAYELRIILFMSEEVLGVTSYFFEGIHGRPHVISMNSGHPSYDGQPTVVQTMVALKEIALRIAARELRNETALGGSATVDKISVRAGTILATILARRKS